VVRKKPLSQRARIAAPVLMLAIIVGIWWFATAVTSVEAWRLPSPIDVAQRGAQILPTSWFWQAASITALEAVLGCLVGFIIAMPTSFAIYHSRIFQAAVEPFLGATQAIPAIALAPLLVLWITDGLASIVALCALMVFFPILVATVLGLRQMDTEVLDAAALDGAAGWEMIRAIEVPLAGSAILAGLRNGFTLSITGAIVGEMVMGGTGLAQTLNQQKHNVDTAGMFVTILVLCVMAMTMFVIISRIERRWHESSSE
jgi:NitT/TauT family transport system permease protein